MFVLVIHTLKSDHIRKAKRKKKKKGKETGCPKAQPTSKR